MSFHAKSGASSSKIDLVMLNLVFGGHFVFWRPFCFLAAILFLQKIIRMIENYVLEFLAKTPCLYQVPKLSNVKYTFEGIRMKSLQ